MLIRDSDCNLQLCNVSRSTHCGSRKSWPSSLTRSASWTLEGKIESVILLSTRHVKMAGEAVRQVLHWMEVNGMVEDCMIGNIITMGPGAPFSPGRPFSP